MNPYRIIQRVMQFWPLWMFFALLAGVGYAVEGWTGAWKIPLAAATLLGTFFGLLIGAFLAYAEIEMRADAWDRARKQNRSA